MRGEKAVGSRVARVQMVTLATLLLLGLTYGQADSRNQSVARQPPKRKQDTVTLKIELANSLLKKLELPDQIELTRTNNASEYRGVLPITVLEKEIRCQLGGDSGLSVTGPDNLSLKMNEVHTLAAPGGGFEIAYQGPNRELELKFGAPPSITQGLVHFRDKSPEEASNAIPLWTYLVGGSGLLLAAAVWLLVISPRLAEKRRGYVSAQARLDKEKNETRASAPTAPPPAQNVSAPIARLEERVEHLHAELQHLQTEAATHNDLAGLEGRLLELADMIKGIEQTGQRYLQQLEEVRAAYEKVQHASNSYWQLVFSDALTEQPKFKQDALEAHDKLIRFFRAGVPKGDGLRDVSERATTLYRGLRSTVDWGRNVNPTSPILPRLAVLQEAASGLCNETETIVASLRDRRLHLCFSVDLAAHEAARSDIFDGMADGLVREVAKWQDPVGYLSAALQAFSVAAVPAVVDLCDKDLDPLRAEAQLQELLQGLITTAGLQEIPVRKHDHLHPEHHEVVQVATGRTPEDRSQTVAQVVARGFLKQHEVHRKASVVVYR